MEVSSLGPTYHAILDVLLRPLVGFQNILEDVHEDFGLMRPQVVLPSLETTHQFPFMSCPSQLCSIELFALKNIWVFTLHENFLNSKINCIFVNFKWFGKV